MYHQHHAKTSHPIPVTDLISRQAGVLNIPSSRRRCNNVCAAILLRCLLDLSWTLAIGDRSLAPLALRRCSGLPAFPSPFHSLLPVGIVEGFWFAPSHPQWTALDDRFTGALCRCSLSSFSCRIVDEGTVGSVRADNRSDLAKWGKERSDGMLGKVVLDTGDE